ncbi:response regulator transcription factor [Catonella massiliensis]|uniref:Stage 0 sporulation protein A homolog n=1 Tax=Catonella massiliensis TaxID=2799636 RepID=A0ABS1J3P2_9FIRM|nr:response regulator transcription factor [Catonella massiliensis]MBK5898751.1 response regulator transcription factor [Catonella massiliensis]
MGKIFIADDERNIRDLLGKFLEDAGHEVRLFENGDSLLTELDNSVPDIVVLDVMMPGIDGFTACGRIRKAYPDITILLLTARDTDADFMTGFMAGCDDYLTKPFSPLKLTLKVNAILSKLGKNEKNTDEMAFGDLSVDVSSFSCRVLDSELKLTKTEFQVLSLLLSTPEKAVSRDKLLSDIWGYSEVETRVTDDTMKRLRKKLKDAGSRVHIETIWGFGFKLTLSEAV